MSGHEDPAAAPQEQPSLISRRSALRGGAATGIAGAALFAAGGPALPEQSREDTDAAWGEYPGRDDDRLYRDRPPHWDDA